MSFWEKSQQVALEKHTFETQFKYGNKGINEILIWAD